MIATLDVPLWKWSFGDQLHEMPQQMFQFRYPRNMAFDKDSAPNSLFRFITDLVKGMLNKKEPLFYYWLTFENL